MLDGLKARAAEGLRRLRRPFHYPAAAWSLLLAYAALIFQVSAQPIGPEITLFPQADKFLHLVEYGLFGALAYHAVRVTRPRGSSSSHLLIAISLGIAYGASDELHQYFVPTREASYADLVIDAIGVIAGAWLLAKQRRPT